MFFSRKSSGSSLSAGEARQRLEQVVQTHLGDADEETRRMVVAVAGLLACVAYADRQYTDEERERIHRELSRIHGLSSGGVDAVCDIIEENILELTITAAQKYTRELRELSDREMRLEVLDILMDLAAADEVVSMSETDFLRRTAAGLGLTADEYQAAQDRHRDKLSILKG
jgi:uncharacterized tellurite resistance protein B-like protein